MVRPLDTLTLDNAAKQYAAWFIADAAPFNRDWIMQQFYNFTYKDEFEHLVKGAREQMGPAALADFDARVAKLEPRSTAVFHRLLAEKRPAGYRPEEE